jgi:hypothetical protein
MKRSVATVRTVSVVLCVLLFAALAQAQYRAALQGVITDAQGAVVSGAKVTLKDIETNRTLQTTSDPGGNYSFSALPPARYRVEVEKQGFKKKVVDDLSIFAEQANALNVQLEVGTASETITVNGDAAPLVDTETATVSGTVTSQDIQKLPSFGRDVFQLAQLAPGAFGDGAQAAGGGSSSLPGSNQSASGATDGIFKTENAPQIVANGTQNEANGITIDGVGVDSITWGGSAVVTPNEESVKEVKIVTNSYDAENGRYSGAQIQVISNNGTNQYHGSLFFKAHRPGLDAYQTWNGPYSVWQPTNTTASERGLQRDTGRFNQFGGSVGGPIWKNKVFGFFSYETLRNNSISTGTGWYETPQFDALASAAQPIAAKMLAFPGEGASYSSIIPRTCASINLTEGVQCNTIAGQGLNIGSPLTTGAGTYDPTWQNTGTPGVGGGLTQTPDIFFVNTVDPTKINDSQYNGRVDINATGKDLVAFSMYRVPVSSTFYNGANRAADLWHHKSTNEAETALWNHTFSPTLINEARMNAAGWRWNEIATNSQEPWGLPQDSFDCVGNGACLNFLGAAGPSVFDQWTYNVKDTLTKVRGSHMLKFGGELAKLEFLDEAPWSARPSYAFHNMWDFLNDVPFFEGGDFNPLTGSPTAVRKDIRSDVLGFFVQDDYKARSNLTINVGLRWEYFQPLHEKNNQISNVVLGSGANALTGMSLRQGGNLFTAPKGNFGPQLGFAWSPSMFHDKTVLRGGIGLSYTGLEEAISLNGRDNPPLVSGVGFCCANYAAIPTIVYGVPSSTSSFFGYPINPSTISAYGSNNLPLTGGPVQVTGFPAHMPTMYTYHYSLDLQEELGHQWVATLGYQGSTSHHLTRQYNQNVVLAAQGIALNPMVNSVDWYANDANSNFNAILAGLRHQFAHSFEADVQYRWSKSMDDGSQPYYEDPYQYYPQESWGRSDYNVANAFKVYGVWSPTIFHGSRGWLEKAAGGWSLSGILNLHSGFPWTAYYSNGTNCNLIYQGSGFCTLRPAAYLGGAGTDYSNSAFESGPGPGNAAVFNKNFSKGALSYFSIPTFTQGPAFPATGPLPQNSTVPRNTLNGPGYFDTDISLNKSFGLPTMRVLGESAKLEFRIDFFNLFNRLNLNGGSITNTISTDGVNSNPAFGQAQNALGSRTLEMQARFNF